MQKQLRHILSFVLFLLALSVLNGFAQPIEERPNILWIVSEDNSPLLGCYGDKFATTPNLDKFAKESVLYENAFSSGPACAISRSTLITGMYATTMGTEQMRSNYPIPAFIKFYPQYFLQAGYYTTNNAKEDYNTTKRRNAWNESSGKATYKNRQPGQPFFAVFNLGITHESNIHKPVAKADLKHNPDEVVLPPYHPSTPKLRHDWALYYDKIEAMDQQVGKLLQELEEAGLADNTIVFYYSDHGGALGRSKRFINDSGLRVPLIIRFPKKFAALAPSKPGSRTDRIVSFEDFAPTVLNLANIKIPAHLQGSSFLGNKPAPEKEYAYAFRGRIDERDELVRSIRNKKYRYVRNFMPQKVYGQYNAYLWRAPSIASWEKSFKAGSLNAAQSAFWKEKPTEELYDVVADPHNINNLAANKKYSATLEKMRSETRKIILQSKDAGFIPEAMRVDISKNGTSYEYARSAQYPLEKILETAEIATARDARHVAELTARLTDINPIVKYWAATGCIILGKQAQAAKANLVTLLKDPEPTVRIAAAEALHRLGFKTNLVPVLTNVLASDNLFARLHALTVLESMGQDAQPALPVVKQFFNKASKIKSTKAGGIAEHDVQIASNLINSFSEGTIKTTTNK